MDIYVNRYLNMERIKVIGLDMDHTLIRYKTLKFEELAFNEIKRKLREKLFYSEKVEALSFRPEIAIRGLVIDTKKGNLLKLGKFGRVQKAFHGVRPLTDNEEKSDYHNLMIDLEHHDYLPVDTAFVVSFASLYAQLVDLKDQCPEDFPQSYLEMAEDIRKALDISHMDGSLKNRVLENVGEFVHVDAEVVETLQKFKSVGKVVALITNSDYFYTDGLLQQAIDPFLSGDSWRNLFDYTVTLAQKPDFFTGSKAFLAIDAQSGMMSNHFGSLEKGVYQGGNAQKFQKDLGVDGPEILYLGDHIYGDILTLKKSCNWRTALVVEDIKTMNKYWGDFMRSGNEISRFAAQVEKYACVYMDKFTRFLQCSPNTVFKPRWMPMPHEFHDTP